MNEIETKQNVTCQLEPMYSYGFDSRMKRPEGTKPCGWNFEVDEKEVFFDSSEKNMTFMERHGMGSFREYYQVCPKCGFIVKVDDNQLTEEQKSFLEEKCMNDRDLFRKMYLFSELVARDKTSTVQENTLVRKRLLGREN